MDIDSCKNVKITNSLISSQDDCIAIKSGKDEEGRTVGIPSENISIENCTFKSGFGVAIGSEMSGGVKNVFVKNCTFENTHSIASIKAIRGRGAYVKNIHYENCSLVNNSTEFTDTKWFRGALYIDGFYGYEEFDADKTAEINDGTPIVDGIYFKDITLETVAGNAIYLCGLPEVPFKNIYLENVKAHGKYGMKVKNIDNLQLVNVDVTSNE
jgi:polygalacturonase